jgi:hypothetical protein
LAYQNGLRRVDLPGRFGNYLTVNFHFAVADKRGSLIA